MIKVVLLTIIIWTLVLIGILSVISIPGDGKYYDCSMAEFQSDYPKDVQEQCRKIRNNFNSTIITI